MHWYEILLIVACALFVTGVIVASIIRKVRGKSSCDCCSDCAHCRHCSHVAPKTDVADSAKKSDGKHCH